MATCDAMRTQNEGSEDIIQVACVAFFAGCVVGCIFGHSRAQRGYFTVDARAHSCVVFGHETGEKLIERSLSRHIRKNEDGSS